MTGAFKCPQGQPSLGTTESGVVCAKDTRRSREDRSIESDEQSWKPLRYHGLCLLKGTSRAHFHHDVRQRIHALTKLIFSEQVGNI